MRKKRRRATDEEGRLEKGRDKKSDSEDEGKEEEEKEEKEGGRRKFCAQTQQVQQLLTWRIGERRARSAWPSRKEGDEG